MVTIKKIIETFTSILHEKYKSSALDFNYSSYKTNDYFSKIYDIDNVICKIEHDRTGTIHYYVNIQQFVFECMLDSTNTNHVVLINALSSDDYTAYIIMLEMFDTRYQDLLNKLVILT